MTKFHNWTWLEPEVYDKQEKKRVPMNNIFLRQKKDLIPLETNQLIYRTVTFPRALLGYEKAQGGIPTHKEKYFIIKGIHE